MLVATFGPSTTWVGKTVTYTDGAFVLEGHGPIRARDVFEYERQGHLEWSMDGVRAWVGAKAQAEGGLVVTPTQTGTWQQDHAAAATPAVQDTAVVEPDGAGDPAAPAAETAEPSLTASVAEAAPLPAQAESVLAAEPVDLAEIASASVLAVCAEDEVPAVESSPVIEPAAVDEPAASADVEDAFAGLGADDPARARAIEEAARDHDWLRLAALYSLQAWWLDEEGRDALQVTRLARRAELRAFLDQGVTLVRVSPADDDTCDACRRVSGRVMTIADALRLMPIPDASCAYKWCRCVWQPADEEQSL